MNSSINVSPTSSPPSQVIHPSGLADRAQFWLGEARRNQSSYLIPVPTASGRSVQQHNSSHSSPSTSPHQLNAPNSPLNGQHPSPPSQMNYLMMHSPDATGNIPLHPSNQTSSPPSHINYLVMHSPDVTANGSLHTSNQTPSPQPQLNYSMMHSPNFTSNSPPTSSDLPPLTTSFPSYFAAFSTLDPNSLNCFHGHQSIDPPPYSTAIAQNNQSEVTYTTLSSVPPYNILPSLSNIAISPISSTLVQNEISYLPSFQEGFDEKMSDLPGLMSIDEGIGTSPETSPGQPSQSSPGIAYGDDSMNASYGQNVSSRSFVEHIQPQHDLVRICTVCGRNLTLRNGHYECEICSEIPLSRPAKRKKKAQVSSRKMDKIICFNCKTENTSLWRRDTNGLPLCNACGLYFKLHKMHRPLTMRKDKIQRRNRKPRNNRPKTPKREPSSPPRDSSPVYVTINRPAIPHSDPSTSRCVQPSIHIAPPSGAAAGPSQSYRLPPIRVQNVVPAYIIQSPSAAVADNNNQNNYAPYSMMEL